MLARHPHYHDRWSSRCSEEDADAPVGFVIVIAGAAAFVVELELAAAAGASLSLRAPSTAASSLPSIRGLNSGLPSLGLVLTPKVSPNRAVNRLLRLVSASSTAVTVPRLCCVLFVMRLYVLGARLPACGEDLKFPKNRRGGGRFGGW